MLAGLIPNWTFLRCFFPPEPTSRKYSGRWYYTLWHAPHYVDLLAGTLTSMPSATCTSWPTTCSLRGITSRAFLKTDSTHPPGGGPAGGQPAGNGERPWLHRYEAEGRHGLVVCFSGLCCIFLSFSRYFGAYNAFIFCNVVICRHQLIPYFCLNMLILRVKKIHPLPLRRGCRGGGGCEILSMWLVFCVSFFW